MVERPANCTRAVWFTLSASERAAAIYRELRKLDAESASTSEQPEEPHCGHKAQADINVALNIRQPPISASAPGPLRAEAAVGQAVAPQRWADRLTVAAHRAADASVT
jgi:hypothetical protein